MNVGVMNVGQSSNTVTKFFEKNLNTQNTQPIYFFGESQTHKHAKHITLIFFWKNLKHAKHVKHAKYGPYFFGKFLNTLNTSNT